MLRQTLRTAIARLNPELPTEAVTRALEIALTSTSPTLILDHQAFHELLLAGVPVSWVDDDARRAIDARAARRLGATRRATSSPRSTS